jgi:hypothetical protein
MPRWNKIVALSLFVVLAGASLGLVTQQHKVASLTAEDYIDIEQLYFAYTHAIDLGEPEGRDYAAVFVPDGVFALVMPNPGATAASSMCPTRGAPWHVGDPDAIRGSMPDKAGLDVCIFTLNGSDDLAAMAVSFHQVNGTTSRHIYTNLRITTAPDGARGLVYFNALDVSTKPPTNTNSGIYEDILMKTPDGWRFKKRVLTLDAADATSSTQ